MDQRSATEVASACPPKQGRLLKWMTACRSCHSYSVTVQPPYNLSKIFPTSVRSLNIHPHPKNNSKTLILQGFLYVFVPLFNIWVVSTHVSTWSNFHGLILIILCQVPSRLISWESTSGLKNAGVASFSPLMVKGSPSCSVAVTWCVMGSMEHMETWQFLGKHRGRMWFSHIFPRVLNCQGLKFWLGFVDSPVKFRYHDSNQIISIHRKILLVAAAFPGWYPLVI